MFLSVLGFFFDTVVFPLYETWFLLLLMKHMHYTFTKNKVPNFSLINDHSEAELPVPAGQMSDLEAGEA